MSDEVVIRRAGAEVIDLLEPLWKAMHAHHESCEPEGVQVAPFRSAGESWRRRRERYEEWLGGDEAFALLAERDGEIVGYAVARFDGEGAALVTGEKTAELESLCVLPGERDAGVGSALMERVVGELRAAGVEVWGLSVMDGNVDALRFYERQGMKRFLVSLIGRIDP